MKLVGLFAVVLSGCVVVDGSGDSAEETREVGDFSGVENTTPIDVSVVAGDQQSVVVRCDDNIVDLIDTKVKGGVLVIKTPNNTSLHPHTDCAVEITAVALDSVENNGSGNTVVDGDWSSLSDIQSSGSGDVKITGALPAVDYVECSGSGEIVVHGVDSADVELDNSGSGGIDIDGAADHATIDSSGSGGVDAMDLQAVDGDIDSSGSGDVRLTATSHVKVDLSGSGDVVLAGDADRDVDDSGSGDVVTR